MRSRVPMSCARLRDLVPQMDERLLCCAHVFFSLIQVSPRRRPGCKRQPAHTEARRSG